MTEVGYMMSSACQEGDHTSCATRWKSGILLNGGNLTLRCLCRHHPSTARVLRQLRRKAVA